MPFTTSSREKEQALLLNHRAEMDWRCCSHQSSILRSTVTTTLGSYVSLHIIQPCTQYPAHGIKQVWFNEWVKLITDTYFVLQLLYQLFTVLQTHTNQTLGIFQLNHNYFCNQWITIRILITCWTMVINYNYFWKKSVKLQLQ